MTAPATAPPLPGRVGPTITRANLAEPGLDQQRLYGLGLQHIQRLSGRIWTDYNVHDPGCTTLELLCYALTDLTARAQLPVEDLLAGGAVESRQFFTAREILPNRPLTTADYRKLLIDLPGVKNAWLRPAELTYYADRVAGTLLRKSPSLPGIHAVAIAGLYDVRLELMDGINTQDEKEQVIRAATERLHANRNLCEDFVSVAPVEQQAFLLCGELELAPDADVVQVQAEALYRVQQYLAPPVYNYTLSEMLDRGKTAPEIFDGPALDCGFIDDDELERAELRTTILLSDVISVVMDIEGVRAVRDMIVSPADPDGPLATRWVVPVGQGAQPRLDRPHCRLVCYKGNMPVVAPAPAVEQHYAGLVEGERQRLEAEHRDDIPIPAGRDRGVAEYHSVQNHFPAVYGVNESWLGLREDDLSGAVRRRRALAYQLKGYLLFFDQIMADYCKQLAQVRELFSTDPAARRTYFSQVVQSITEWANLYGDSPGTHLDALIEDGAAAIERRNRFLDHLIARFAERFHDYAQIMRSAFGTGPASLIPVKCEFLRNYPAISSERSLAYNRSLTEPGALWDSTNVSGFERRLARLLDIPNPTRRNLSELPYDLYPEIDTTPGNEFRFRVKNRVTNEIILSSSRHYVTAEAAREEMMQALQRGQLPEGFERKVTKDGRFYFNIIDETGEVIARRIEYFDTAEHRDRAIDELMVALRSYSEQGSLAGEGTYVIENILLRPMGPDDPFLPICVDPNCTDCEDDDPYSYRLHVVLPAFAGRFANMDFRRFAEEVIREETPAHILPKVCWIDKDDMGRLESAYREWLTQPSAARLEAFRDALYSVKNVYPTQLLNDCDSEATKPKFILGQSALGSEGAAESPP